MSRGNRKSFHKAPHKDQLSVAFRGYCLAIFCLFFFSPDEALAWGPAFHASLAMSTLAKAALLAPGIRKLLERFPNDYLYGNLSADIILGKKFIDYYYHCHNWRVGLQIFNYAKTDAQKAFSLGYLSHLAADTIAHNIFVPDKLVRTYQTLTAKHVYWEVRFDQRFDPKILHHAYEIAKNYHEKNDALLQEILQDTIFTFKTNKKIFNGLFVLQKHVRVQNLLQGIARRSPLQLEEERANRYMDLAQKAVIDTLNELDRAQSTQADPAGHQKLDLAQDLRKKMKKIRGDGSAEDTELKRLIERFHEILNDTLLSPESCPEALDILDKL